MGWKSGPYVTCTKWSIKVQINVSEMSLYWSITTPVPLDETHLDAVRGLIKLRRFHLSASTNGACQRDPAMANKNKQICFRLMLRSSFNMEEFRLE